MCFVTNCIKWFQYTFSYFPIFHQDLIICWKNCQISSVDTLGGAVSAKLDLYITTLIFITNSPARVFGGTVDIKSKNSIKFCQKINHGYQRSLHFWHGLWAGRKSLVIGDYHHIYGKILRFSFMISKDSISIFNHHVPVDFDIQIKKKLRSQI